MRPRRPEPRLSDTLASAVRQLKPREVELVRDMLKHYTVQFVKLERQSAKPIDIAGTLHELVDEHLAKTLKESPHAPEVKCRRGCNHCCHIPVTISSHEAQLAVAFAEEQGIDLDRERLERQRSAQDPAAWRALPRAHRACVFLGSEGECRVYQHRPSPCRKYLVITDPDFCDVDKHPGHEVGRLFSMEAEIIDSAAMTAASDVGPMASVILRVLEEREAPMT